MQQKFASIGLRLYTRGMLFMCLISLGGCSKEQAKDSKTAVNEPARDKKKVSTAQTDGHKRMLALLAQIKDELPTNNPVLGERGVREMEKRFKELFPLRIPDRIVAGYQLGKHYLRLGKNQLAAKTWGDALLLVDKIPGQVPPDFIENLTYQLGLAHFRIGEKENCVAGHNEDSCLFPIRGKGVHKHKEGAREATRYFLNVLKLNPNHLKSRWLLNIAYMALGEYPSQVPSKHRIPEKSFRSEESFPRFYDRAPSLGLDIVTLAGGAAAEDFNGDDYLDIVVSTWNPAGQIRIFMNTKDGLFEEQTSQAGLDGIYGGLNLIHADYNNDGHEDILVLRGAWLGPAGRMPNSLLKNVGQGKFKDVTFDVGLGEVHYPTQTAAWADYDLDGDLDLYVGNENFPNQLFENVGGEKFTDVGPKAGVNS